ncbi:MAG TPA: MerR family transcriptional regulator [Nocardioidaceae bacterium]|nr:MerR family transcriptional regulator [Nocardioidaceae bacterium]
MNDGVMRIGELSRRTGVSPELLRAWELRYGLLQPARSPGGFRLYSSDDEGRIRRTAALISEGLSAAEAARLAAAPPHAATAVAQPMVDDLADGLRKALDGFDTTAGHAALDRLFGTVSVEFAITEVLIPYLHDLGERWADGSVTVAQEHFASNLIRGRVLGLARDWGAGGSGSAVLACPPGEAHDLGLILFGILIARRGWRVTFLGADTPFDTLGASVRSLRPSLVVVATRDADLFGRHAAAIAAIAADLTVAVAAPVSEQAVRGTGARPLVDDIAEAAEALIGS